MSEILTVFILNESMVPIFTKPVSEWYLSVDYVGDTISSFVFDKDITKVEIGDLIFAKAPNMFKQVEYSYQKEVEGLKLKSHLFTADTYANGIIFTGVVSTINGNSIDATNFTGAFNYERPIYNKVPITTNGEMFRYLIENYPSRIPGLINPVITLGGIPPSDPYKFIPASNQYVSSSDNSSVINVRHEFVKMFKNTGYTLKPVELYSLANGKYELICEILKSSKVININDETNTIINIDVYTTNTGSNDDGNCCIIYDPNAITAQNDGILDIRYRDKNGDLQTSLTVNVDKPIKPVYYAWDPNATDKPSYDSVAADLLPKSTYNHEITVTITYDNLLLMGPNIQIGATVNIKYLGKEYTSILTGYTIDSSSNLVQIICGYVRSTLQTVI